MWCVRVCACVCVCVRVCMGALCATLCVGRVWAVRLLLFVGCAYATVCLVLLSKLHGLILVGVWNAYITSPWQVAGRAHGLGTQLIVGRDTYTGEWIQNMREGRGVCEYANGCR